MSFSVRGIPELQRRLKAIDKATGRTLLQQIQLDAVSNAKKTVPRKTGNLGASIKGGSTTDRYTIVRARANYAAYVEFDTRPHVIRPKNGKVLAWPATAGGRRLSGSPTRRALAGNVRPTGINTGRSAIGPNSGTFRYARVVHHPGTKGQPFLIPGASKAIEDNIGAAPIIRAWNKAA